MSDETPGAGQGALPPREATPVSRTVAERPAMRLTHVVGGQYVLTTPSHGAPALAQLSPVSVNQNSAGLQQGAVTRIISISPSRTGQTSPLRPSLANQSIVNVLTKPRVNTNLHLQLYQNAETNASSAVPPQLAPMKSPVKRPATSTSGGPVDKKDRIEAKLKHVMNYRVVRSKLLKEKYMDHLLEMYFIESGSNLLDFPHFMKRPKSAHCAAFLKEHSLDPKGNLDSLQAVPAFTSVPSTPSATPASSLPGISHSSTTVMQTVEAPSAGVKPPTMKLKTPTQGNQEQIVEKAKQEAYVVQRINDLQKEGLWSEKRLPKIQEMPRNKTHWDYLLEEMVWLAADFAQERKWKKAAAKKCAKMVQKYFQDKASAAQKAEKAHEQNLRRIAAFCAREIKTFWANVEKLVEYKQHTILEEKRKKALDQQLSFIVDQTEKYSQLLAEGMNKTTDVAASNLSSASVSRANSDVEFYPGNQSSTDDEETIEQEEANLDKKTREEEVAALQKESEMDLDDFLKELPKDYLQNRDKIVLSDEESDDEKNASQDDKDFEVESTSEEDDEATIDEEEKQEDKDGEKDHEKELDDLRAENEMSIEELRRKYSGVPDIQVEEEENSEASDSEKETAASDNECSLSEQSDEEMDMSDKDEVTKAGLEMLIDDNQREVSKTDEKDDLINDAAAIAESIQPKGNTLSSTTVSTVVPFLLKYPLREYQHIGLDWLVTMCDRRLNGILADEMGLGKTIQTIALLAHLACEKENWGPHLIVVPTSVMLNWEMECKKWCPAFKILTYYGTQKERKLKRTGWTKPNAFHICITSYKLVIQDHQSFRRKKWKYLILDEAQNIKNFKSQRWQLLLNFQTQQRLLLTGTPLQNNLMELWSLMHFLMPNVFQSHREFKEWFSNPVTGMIEGNNEYNETIIKRLHKVLRPFLLRRLKSEVEKQMPKKYEHVVMCRLSKRQRYLYDDYMSRAKTKETLATGNLLSVINVLMQLRKVCNHPNLFEVRPTVSPFHTEHIIMHIPSLIFAALEYNVWKDVSLDALNLNLLMMELRGISAYQCYRSKKIRTPPKIIELYQVPEEIPPCPPSRLVMRVKTKSKELKFEKKEVKTHIQPNLKLKVDSHGGVQLVQQQGSIVKAIPVNIAPGATANLAQGNNSLLKIDNKLGGGLSAQLVQTLQGKRLFLTSTGNIPITTNSQGQKVIPVNTKHHLVAGNNTQPIAKAFVNAFPIHKFGSVHSNAIAITNSSVPNATADLKTENTKVGTKFLDQLYSKQNILDVRWSNKTREDNEDVKEIDSISRLNLMARINEQRCSFYPLYGTELRELVKINSPLKREGWINGSIHCMRSLKEKGEVQSELLKEVLSTPEKRISQLSSTIERFVVYVPPANAKEAELQVWHPIPSAYKRLHDTPTIISRIFAKPSTLLHNLASAMVTQFPDPRLIQYDCGKLQTLDPLLRNLKSEGHRVLIFTQMTKMLDVLEAFLNFHGHIYLRLDGTTKVDQRQVLMERFNGDPRIFAFILSTRSGGVGVNLTGADTVIFYDSDWNPTMDAQAQDRCHRIGQTRDVHIYRLISERTIEENILKKANQKRLLGNLAIEGGNFTTAYFKSTTIQDLFTVDSSRDAAQRMSNITDTNSTEANENTQNFDDKNAVGVLENALASCEDDQDVQAARTAKAEAVADLAEFDENIPLDDTTKDKEPEASKAEQEIENVIKQLTPIERYAMKFIEETESAWSAEQLAAAERLIEEQKLEWEQNRLAAMKEEEERRAKELQEENELLTYTREDAENQMWVSENTMEQMPMWCPPTPPQQENDVYIDSTMSFLYDTNVMSESQLPPVYIKKELKRTRVEAGLVETRRSLKVPRKEESISTAPRSLFYQHAVFKIRRDAKWQKYRGTMRSAVSVTGKPSTNKLVAEQPLWHDWTIHEDMALLKVIQNFQGLPLNLTIVSPGHVPNWDFVADYVNTVSITYRSPKQCRQRYENSLMQREEGKQVYDSNIRKKKNKATGAPVGSLQKFVYHQKSNRPMRTSQLYAQDNNASFSQIMVQRYESLKNISSKHPSSQNTTTRQSSTGTNTILQKNPKHTAVLNECGIDFDRPILPVEVANRRQERLAREKKMTPEARLQIMKGIVGQSVGQSSSNSATSNTANLATTQASTISQGQTANTVASLTTTTPSTPPKLLVISDALRGQRIITSPLQSSNVVSVSSLSPAQLQAAQRLIVSANSTNAGKTVVTQQMQGKSLSPAQLQIIRQAASFKQQLRVQNQIGGVKTTTVTIGGQPAVVQFSQAQPSPRAQFVRQAGTTVQVGGKAAITRTVTESEVAQILKKQQQLQQQKALAAAAAANQPTSIQNLSSQLLAQTFQQAGSSGTPVATLVKTVSSAGGSQTTVTIPVTGVAITAGGKGLQPSLKSTTPQQLRQLQLQQQLLAQKKLGAAGAQKLSIGQVAAAAGKGNVQTQLIVGSKPLSTAMTVQQFQQVIRSPLGVSQGPVVLAKGTPRVIPVNAGLGTKQTIQVVTATSQGLSSAFRPQSSSTLAGALTGVKVQTNAQAQQALLSQVSVALQNQGIGVRQGSPVRIQTANGTPLVAVTVQSPSSTASSTAHTSAADSTTLRYTKK